jgi:tetratricopeptide (TPR) repeat protein
MEMDLNSRIDRYMNRELHPAAARALAYQALDDSDLFEELTAIGLVQAALESPATTDRGLAQSALDDEDLFDTLVARGAVEASLLTPHRRNYWPVAIAGAAAAAGLLAFLVLRPPSQPVPRPVQQARVTAAVLLSSDLKPAFAPGTPIFRGVPREISRAPKSDGTISSVEDGVATVNLGSIDGVVKGTALTVIRNKPIGRIIITTIFRERSRGKIADGDGIQAKDMVRVPNATHLGAILQQVDSLASAGDLKAARELARKSLTGDRPGETRPLLERLAALEYQAHATAAARERYEVAVNNFDQPPVATPSERALTLANYGALSLLGANPQRAEDLLQKALASATDPALRSQIFNNLGAIAEARLDRAKAASYYNQALAQNPAQADRAIVEANLARLNATTHP